MKNLHKVVTISIQTIEDDVLGTFYIASNSELGVFVKGSSFRELLTQLRKELAIASHHANLSLRFMYCEGEDISASTNLYPLDPTPFFLAGSKEPPATDVQEKGETALELLVC